jgi:hypothetical protein
METTYVSHGSTRGTPSISILLRFLLERTILRYLYGVPSRQSHGSLKGLEERATVGPLFVTGHLRGNFGLAVKTDEIRE